MAPPQADQPIFNPLGCQITKMSVAKKIIDANIAVVTVLTSISHTRCKVPVPLVLIFAQKHLRDSTKYYNIIFSLYNYPLI